MRTTDKRQHVQSPHTAYSEIMGSQSRMLPVKAQPEDVTYDMQI